jgi:hypothetical protein
VREYWIGEVRGDPTNPSAPWHLDRQIGRYDDGRNDTITLVLLEDREEARRVYDALAEGRDPNGD